ncbi:MAG: nicotinate-nucleotide diphosphorylase (carboxylating), partial [Acidaminococcus sp.]|nr:nicotinate-nucleotide diphosphorylase (carboxylating) [Acidaminococcus sp.]
GVKEALARAKADSSHMTKLELSEESLEQAIEAVQGGADVLMLDNMAPDEMKERVDMIGHRAVVEASGGITAKNLAAAAAAGVDVISVGALTHSVKAVDISLDVGKIK